MIGATSGPAITSPNATSSTVHQGLPSSAKQAPEITNPAAHTHPNARQLRLVAAHHTPIPLAGQATEIVVPG